MVVCHTTKYKRSHFPAKKDFIVPYYPVIRLHQIPKEGIHDFPIMSANFFSLICCSWFSYHPLHYLKFLNMYYCNTTLFSYFCSSWSLENFFSSLLPDVLFRPYSDVTISFFWVPPLYLSSASLSMHSTSYDV